jgi:hypothetical protein
VSAIVLVVVLSITDAIQCSEDQGAGSIALIVMEIPLFLVTTVFSHKSKKIIRSGSGYLRP